MKTKLLHLLLLTSLVSFAQTKFENGYFIRENNEKITCLIKNYDWINNPTEIEYKLTDNGETTTANITQIKEFGIDNHTKFIRSQVKIERSSQNSSSLSRTNALKFEDKTVFLKIIIEGEATLYSFSDKDSDQFFFNVGNGKIEQLIYKEYLNADSQLAKNEYYKQQLYNNLSCESLSRNEFVKVDYRMGDLIALFQKYNTCKNSVSNNYEQKKEMKHKPLSLYAMAGMSSTIAEIKSNQFSYYDAKFDSQTGFWGNIQLEYYLPIWNNKFSTLLQMNYESFKGETSIFANGFTDYIKIEYKAFNIAPGVRYHFYLNKKNQFYANIFGSFNFVKDSKVTWTNRPDMLIEGRTRFVYGLGYIFNDKIILDLQFSQTELFSEPLWDSKYKIFSLSVGYNILPSKSKQ